MGFSWTKTYRSGKPFIGLGFYTRQNTEVCLIGTKGKTASMVIDHSISSVISSEIEKHSRKPAIVRNLIVKLLGDRPRVELFSRDYTEGWDVWGNEVECTAELGSAV